ncbi:MAG TPA: XdhC family protein [Steroidobacteraceae bacterium]|jgi:xanthine/CO dehydrogenase XdhC/CoxF family maturation factor|nr:XdhC family protein [Steroidobacteraceae bacterium]
MSGMQMDLNARAAADAGCAHADRADVRLDTSLELLLERAPPGPIARVLATAVATAGSTYCKAGARMLIMADGSYVGLLSGGCLEADLKLHAQEVIASGVARAIEYDMRGPDDILFGIGAGCEGAMRVLLEPAHAAAPAAAALAAAGRTTRSGTPTFLVAVHESTQLSLGTYSSASLPPPLLTAAKQSLADAFSREIRIDRGDDRLRAFVQYLPPPPHLLVCGAGPDAQPVVTAARDMGWRVTVVDHRPAYADARRFPGATVICADARSLRAVVDLELCHAAVVMSHHLHSDVVYLRELSSGSAPGYVGLLGPAARRQRIAQELGSATEGLRNRLRGPVGIDIGAITPEAIALAIVAQVHAWLAGRPTGATAMTVRREPI